MDVLRVRWLLAAGKVPSMWQAVLLGVEAGASP